MLVSMCQPILMCSLQLCNENYQYWHWMTLMHPSASVNNSLYDAAGYQRSVQPWHGMLGQILFPNVSCVACLTSPAGSACIARLSTLMSPTTCMQYVQKMLLLALPRACQVGGHHRPLMHFGRAIRQLDIMSRLAYYQRAEKALMQMTPFKDRHLLPIPILLPRVPVSIQSLFMGFGMVHVRVHMQRHGDRRPQKVESH